MSKNENSRIISPDEVKSHTRRGSCWFVIRNEVYDVTKFLAEHPGGEDPLLEAAGQDATVAFDDVGHSQDAIAMLEKYHIGSLAPDKHRSLSVSSPDSSNPSHGEKSLQCFKCADRCRGRPTGPCSKPTCCKGTQNPEPRPGRVQTIRVPIEETPPPPPERRGAEYCRPPPRPPSSPPESSRLKYAVVALAAAIILGLAYKKFA